MATLKKQGGPGPVVGFGCYTLDVVRFQRFRFSVWTVSGEKVFLKAEIPLSGFWSNSFLENRRFFGL